MKIQIITLFPEMFDGAFDYSMFHKAKEQKVLEIEFVNLRDYGLGPRKQVDDTPYGGGDGMLLMPEPLFRAIEEAKRQDKTARVIVFTPRGETYAQATAQKLADKKNGLILVCGRYEGIDERISELADMQLSIGNYVLTGGEIPAMVVVDSVMRLIPGVLGGEQSAEIESFADGKTVEYAQYTRPEDFRGLKVPEVLLNGNHAEIAAWRQKEATERTKRANKDQ